MADRLLTPFEVASVLAMALVLAVAALPRLVGSKIAGEEGAIRHDLLVFARAQDQVFLQSQVYALVDELTGEIPFMGRLPIPPLVDASWKGLAPDSPQQRGAYQVHLAADSGRKSWALLAWPDSPATHHAYAIGPDLQLLRTISEASGPLPSATAPWSTLPGPDRRGIPSPGWEEAR